MRGTFTDLVDLLYVAALQPAHWDDALRLIASRSGAEAAGIRVEGTRLTQRWVGLEPAFHQAYVEHYWRDDPWVRSASDLRVGGAACGEGIVPRRTLEKSAFYNELCRPYGLDDLVGGVVSRDSDRIITLGVMGASGRRFREDHKREIERLLPHLRRALAIGEHLFGAASGDEARPTLEERLRLHYGLTRAEARVAVQIGHGRAPKEVAASSGTSWNTVRTQLRRVFAKTKTSRQCELAVLIARADRGTSATPRCGAPLPDGEDAAHEMLRSELARQFRLTGAEARVAAYVGSGVTLREIADHSGITRNTVRTLLQRVYAKTHVRSQTELSRLIMDLQRPDM